MNKIVLVLFLMVGIATVINGQSTQATTAKPFTKACTDVTKHPDEAKAYLIKLKAEIAQGTVDKNYQYAAKYITDQSNDWVDSVASCEQFFIGLVPQFKKDCKANDLSETDCKEELKTFIKDKFKL